MTDMIDLEVYPVYDRLRHSIKTPPPHTYQISENWKKNYKLWTQIIDLGVLCEPVYKTEYLLLYFQAHGSKGVMSMIANPKVDQLISAGKG